MSNQWTNRQRVPFTASPVRELRQPVPVESVNEHGFRIITQHIYLSGVEAEKVERKRCGHTEIK